MKTDRIAFTEVTAAFVGAFALGVAGALAACSGAPNAAPSAADTSPTDPSNNACQPCVTDADCGGGVCAQIASDSYCAADCASQACPSGATCTAVTTVDGKQANACVPADNACGAVVGPGSAGSSGAGGPPNAGPPVTGSIGANGGKLSRLLFGVVGDTRPPVINDTKGYPTAVITKIYSSIEGLALPFAVSTGDYVFSTGNGTQAAPQFDLYLGARGKYSGTLFPAMGNHECTGSVTSNCGLGTTDGTTNNYSAFLSKLLAPIGKTKPNYSVDIDAADGSWTSKLVFVAGNAWTSADATWLDATLAKPTTYTFVIRHEPRAASNAPGCKGSEAIMAQHPYTLAIVGHTHTYGRTGPKQVTIGNGGAPLTGGASYGFGMIQQRADGAIQVDMIDSTTGNADTGFRFALKADGSPAP